MRWVFVAVALVLGLSRVIAQEAKSPTVKVEDTWTYLVTTEGKKAQRQSHAQIEVTKAEAPLVVMSITEVGSKKKPVEQSVADDWAQSKAIGGRETVVNRPFVFPLAPKKTWSIDYVEPSQGHPHGKEHIHAAYTAVGWETVTVPAGDFKALKVECEALWVPDNAPVNAPANATSGAPRTGAPIKSGGTLAKPIAAKPGDDATLDKGPEKGPEKGPGKGTEKAPDKAPAKGAEKTPEKAVPKAVDKPQEKLVRTYWYVPEVKRWVKSVEEHYAANGTRTDSVTEELEAYMTTE